MHMSLAIWCEDIRSPIYHILWFHELLTLKCFPNTLSIREECVGIQKNPSTWVCLTIIYPTVIKKLPLQSFFFNKLILFIYFWLRWVFIAPHGLSLLAAREVTLHCGVRASHCSGFSCCEAQALGVQASVVAAQGLSSCGSWAQ